VLDRDINERNKMIKVTTKNHFGKHDVDILFAYVKSNGYKTGDNDIRLVLEESTPDEFTHTAFLEPKHGDDTISPYEYGVQFYHGTPMLEWMIAERKAGRLLDGETYTFKNKSITLLMPNEIQDIIDRGVTYTKGHYETRPY
jgi:hypothetical protein